ncbi:MAG: aminotransferase class I/II-fold pyridoxal phosphate-dependent enzyme [Ardenticatenaceae bacterium]|nr:aminotransferase class I/II-fold pyridoxal phosphate-dependent enzyme [Ardenticatenaceae bacterium]
MNKTYTTYKHLAIFQGKPLFSEKLHVGRPNIGSKSLLFERLQDILERRWLTNDGPYVREMESEISRLIGVKHCIAVNNATIGLEIAARSLDLKGEVIVPSFTFIATAHALQWLGIKPIFCDVYPKTHNIDPRKVESLISEKTTGIVGVHLWGRPCEIDALTEIAHKHNLKLLFDAAHAFGCSFKGRMLGNFGDVEVYSFHATKFLNSFEGGAIVTNDDRIAEKARALINFGYDSSDNIAFAGTNGKMSEISAAMGLTGLASLNEFISVNSLNHQTYVEELADVPGVNVIRYNEDERNNYQYIILEIDEEKCGLTRDNLMRILQNENVLARRYFHPGCHRAEPYASDEFYNNLYLPETERLSASVLALPNGTAVSEVEIKVICQIIRVSVTYAKEIINFLS